MNEKSQNKYLGENALDVAPILPGGTYLTAFPQDKVTFAAIQAAIEAVAAAYSLFKTFFGSRDDNRMILEALDKVANELEVIKRAIIEIQRFLILLPAVIDRTVEEKFSDYINNRLRSQLEKYFGIKASHVRVGNLDDEQRKQLELLYHDMTLDVGTIKGYGAPATAILALMYLAEDDIAAMLSMAPEDRVWRLKRYKSHFSNVLDEFSSLHGEYPLVEYTKALKSAQMEMDKFLNWVDDNVVGESSSSTGWVCGPWSGTWRSGGSRTCVNTSRTIGITGNRNTGYQFVNIEHREERKEYRPGDRPDIGPLFVDKEFSEAIDLGVPDLTPKSERTQANVNRFNLVRDKFNENSISIPILETLLVPFLQAQSDVAELIRSLER